MDAASDNSKEYATLRNRSHFYRLFKRVYDPRLSHAGNQKERNEEDLEDNPYHCPGIVLQWSGMHAVTWNKDP